MKNLVLTTTVLALTLNGCGQAGKEQSETKITGGMVVSQSAYPAVVALSTTNAIGTFSCTGTFVSDYQVLTAAHCVKGISKALVTLPNGSTAKALSWSYNPEYDSVEYGADLGLINFPKQTSSAKITLGSRPAVGDSFSILGYGNTTIGDYYYRLLDENGEIINKIWQHTGSDGQLRGGTNTIDAMSNGLISFVGEMKDTNRNTGNAASSTGDSGGPLLVGGKLVGVTSFGNPDLGAWKFYASTASGDYYRAVVKKVTTSYIDLNTTTSRAYLSAHSL